MEAIAHWTTPKFIDHAHVPEHCRHVRILVQVADLLAELSGEKHIVGGEESDVLPPRPLML